MSSIWSKTLANSTFCGDCGNINDKIFIKEESSEMLKILRLITNVNELNIYE